MTKSELVEKMASELEAFTRKDAADTVEWIFSTVMEALREDNRFSYTGFGSFTVNTKKARKGRNPRTSEEIDIPARKAVKFNASMKLKEFINTDD